MERQVLINPGLFSEIYSPRHINNIYFDSHNLRSYFGNVDGSMIRVKARIRWYGDLFGRVESPVLEFKIKCGIMGKKESFKGSSFIFDDSIDLYKIHDAVGLDQLPDSLREIFTPLKPVMVNRYRRKYFLSADKQCRITIDHQQSFRKIHSHSNSFFANAIQSGRIVLEVKYNYSHSEQIDQITGCFPIRMMKNSKYVAGMDYLYG